MKNSAQLINSTNMDVEYFTPPFILERVRFFLDGIDLDPASSEEANKHVQARRFWDMNYNPIAMKWEADNVWMNHPFGRAEGACISGCLKDHVHHDYKLHGNAAWINHMTGQFNRGHFREGICITFAATSEKWFQPLMQFPQCFLSPRTNYYLPDGTIKKGVTKGSVLTYMGPDWWQFKNLFSEFGTVKI